MSQETPDFKIGDTVYGYQGNPNPEPLVYPFLIQGVLKHPEGFFYTHDLKQWLKEDTLFETQSDAYTALINQIIDESPDQNHRWVRIIPKAEMTD